MNTFLRSLLAVTLAATAAQAQESFVFTPPPPATIPAAGKDPGLIQRPSLASDTQILEYGSFELPRVTARTPKEKGGNPILLSRAEWSQFDHPKEVDGGTLVTGLSNEVARTGRQSVYVEFSKLTRHHAQADLSSQLIHIKPLTPYRVAIWGQMDKKQPLTIAQRIPNLRLQLDYFNESLDEQVDQEFYVQPMPGSRNRPPFFGANRWSEYYVEVKPPLDAHYLKITWTWVATGEGETNGVMYFDDAALIGERVIEPEEEDTDEVEMEKAEPGAPAAEGAAKPKAEGESAGAADKPAPSPSSAAKPGATPKPPVKAGTRAATPAPRER